MSGRDGYALLLVVGLLLVLTTLSMGMLTIGSRETLLADQWERQARLGALAESGVRAHVAAWSTRDAVTAPVGSVSHPDLTPDVGESLLRPDELVRLEVLRLEPTLFRVEGEAVNEHLVMGSLGARAAMLVSVLDPEATTAQFPAALVADSAELMSGAVVAASACPSPSGPYPAAQVGVLKSLDPAVQFSGVSPIEVGTVQVVDSAGPFAGSRMLRLANFTLDLRTVVPQPTAHADDCVRGGTNWGAVSSSHPCHDLLPVIHAAGPVVVEQGEGRGVLFVDGDLTLSGTFRYHGLLFVTGRLIAEEDVVIRGSVRASSLHLGGARIEADPCVMRAAASAPAFDRAFRPSIGSWVPAF